MAMCQVKEVVVFHCWFVFTVQVLALHLLSGNNMIINVAFFFQAWPCSSAWRLPCLRPSCWRWASTFTWPPHPGSAKWPPSPWMPPSSRWPSPFPKTPCLPSHTSRSTSWETWQTLCSSCTSLRSVCTGFDSSCWFFVLCYPGLIEGMQVRCVIRTHKAYAWARFVRVGRLWPSTQRFSDFLWKPRVRESVDQEEVAHILGSLTDSVLYMHQFNISMRRIWFFCCCFVVVVFVLFCSKIHSLDPDEMTCKPNAWTRCVCIGGLWPSMH